MARQGDRDAQNLLIENNLGFIRKTAYEIWSTQKELNEAFHMVIRGECVSACAYLKEKGIQVDLVYIDPPFASGADYAKKVYVRRNPKVAAAIAQAEQELDFEDLKAFEETMYGDVWDKEKYLNWMYENLMAIKSIMSDNASIYVHLDYHIGHYVKILLDEVFGESCFRNEIIWKRATAHNATDISAIYDTVQKAVGAAQASLTVATAASQRLSDRYTEYLATRTLPSEQAKHETPSTSLLAETTTDDERVVLYYILTNKVKRVQKSDIQAWMTDHEIYNVNVENAFDLLASLGAGTHENETLNMDIATFRKYTSSTDELIPMLKSVVESHQMLSSERFLTMWANGSFTDEAKLFVAYIIQNRVTTLGARWMAQGVEDSIHQWELNNCLDISVSSTYSTHLNQFIDNHFVYESSWTSYGNAREYTLCSSLRRLLLEADFPYAAEIVTVMEAHKEIFPF